MQISQFNGGLATRLDPSLIDAKYSVLCDNVDNSTGVLKSAKDLTKSSTAIGKFFHNFDATWISQNDYADFLEYREALYYTDPTTFPKKYKNGVTTKLGIDRPIAIPAFNGSSPIFDEAGVQYNGIVPVVSTFNMSDISYSFSSLTTGDLTAATYNYRFALSQNGIVIKYIDASYTTAATGSVLITMQPLGGVKVNVYRQYSGTYRYIGQVSLTEAKTISDTVLDISSAEAYYSISDLSVAYSTVAGGNLPANLYSYRFAKTYDSKVYEYIDSTYTSSGTNSVKLTFNALGGARIQVYRLYSGTYRYIGSVTLSADSTTFIDSILDISSNTAFTQTGITYGVVQYTMTYYNGTTGIESAPMDFSSEVTVKLGDKVQVTRIPLATDPQVTSRRIYRLGGNLTEMSLIKEITDNYTTSFYDYTDDVDFTTLLDSYSYLPPPAGIKYLTEAYGILFAADGKDLVFSLQGFPEAWPSDNRINFDAVITGLLPTSNGLLIGTEYKVYLLAGTSPGEFQKLLITAEQGVLDNRAFRLVKGLPLWVSHDGYCSLNSGIVEVISKDLLGKISLDVLDCIVYDEVYIVLLTDGSLHVLDLRYTPNFVTYHLSSKLVRLGVFKDTLYGVSEDLKLCTLFNGAQLSFLYSTGTFTEGVHSQTKLYNKVYIRFNGTFTINMYIDSELVGIYNLSGDSIEDITPPVEKQRGFNISFTISGIGTIYELEYKAMGRQIDG